MAVKSNRSNRGAGRGARPSPAATQAAAPASGEAVETTAPDPAIVAAPPAPAVAMQSAADIAPPPAAPTPIRTTTIQTQTEHDMTDSNKIAADADKAGNEFKAAGDRATDAARNMQDQFAQNASKAADGAQATMSEMNDRARDAMTKSAKLVEDMNEFNKGNIEALVESSRAAARHAEALGQQTAEFGRKSYEQASAAMKEMASIKSPTDLFRVQSEYARQAFDQMVAETSRNSEAMLKAAGDVFQPLSNRLAVAADKLKVGG